MWLFFTVFIFRGVVKLHLSCGELRIFSVSAFSIYIFFIIIDVTLSLTLKCFYQRFKHLKGLLIRHAVQMIVHQLSILFRVFIW